MVNDFISRSIRYDFQYISSKSNFKELIVNGGCIKCSVFTERSYMKSRNRILRSSQILKNKKKNLVTPTRQAPQGDTVLSESKGAHSLLLRRPPLVSDQELRCVCKFVSKCVCVCVCVCVCLLMENFSQMEDNLLDKNNFPISLFPTNFSFTRYQYFINL